jgi:hypothetical protein
VEVQLYYTYYWWTLYCETMNDIFINNIFLAE